MKGNGVRLEVHLPVHVSRPITILRFFFGVFYVRIPHYACLLGRCIASAILAFLAWWAILFAGRYPTGWHAFNVGTYRWSIRVYLYLAYLTDKYPPFSGKE
jgi:hypothetical protein